jgi:hypothetical protein
MISSIRTDHGGLSVGTTVHLTWIKNGALLRSEDGSSDPAGGERMKHVELQHVTKRFPNVTALSDISFDERQRIFIMLVHRGGEDHHPTIADYGAPGGRPCVV